MKVSIKTKPNSHEEKVEKISDPAPNPPLSAGRRMTVSGKVWCGAGTEFVVSVKEPPVHGLANKAIIRALANHFGIASARIKIVSGWTSRSKVVEIL